MPTQVRTYVYPSLTAIVTVKSTCQSLTEQVDLCTYLIREFICGVCNQEQTLPVGTS